MKLCYNKECLKLSIGLTIIVIGIFCVMLDKVYNFQGFMDTGYILAPVGGGLFGSAYHKMKKKKIREDELTDWISGKSSQFTFWITAISIGLLIGIVQYKSSFFNSVNSLYIILGIMTGTYLLSFLYFSKVKRIKGY